jgi:sigma-B regulation protein RsbU (phosphoserine phosphatase)
MKTETAAGTTSPTRPRLLVRDLSGEREVVLDTFPFTIGRRDDNHLRLAGSEVSREHAEIVQDGATFGLQDRGSRYGTFVNDEAVTGSIELRSGDRIRLGRGGGAELVFLASETSRTHAGARDDLRHVAAALAGVRALGGGRVLQDVLALVLDASLEVSGAERGFLMLADSGQALELKHARGRGRKELPESVFATSRKIPEDVFTSGRTRVVADLMDPGMVDAHQGTVALGIRHVVCVPLVYVQYVESADAKAEDRRLGVLYLDSRERGILASESTRSALEALAAEAAIAIENARLYRERLEKVKLDQEMRIAAAIQQALLPQPAASLGYVEVAAASVPCRSIGGDFFDYFGEPGTSFGFALGDVAGKGPPAALLSALMQGMLAGQTSTLHEPAASVGHVNRALCRRGIESRFVTIFVGGLTLDGRLTYCNGGHNPPFVLGARGVSRLETGGPVIGLLDAAGFDEETVVLERGDLVVIFSDGVSEASNAEGEEFGDARILEVIEAGRHRSAAALVDDLVSAVRAFAAGAPQSDDITAMVVRYLGPGGR